MLPATFAPPLLSGFLYAMEYPGQVPVDLPVEGQGFTRWNSAFEREVRETWLVTMGPWIGAP